MFGELGKMMKAASEMKKRMRQVQAKLEASEFSAEAGGGQVRAVVNGKGRITDVEIDEELLADDGLDAEMLGDLIKAAVSAAQDRAAEAAAETLRELTGGMDIPGMQEMT
jgi:DNA-binding YbaB/EbfC family protein